MRVILHLNVWHVAVFGFSCFTLGYCMASAKWSEMVRNHLRNLRDIRGGRP
jgi:hypothetical protein